MQTTTATNQLASALPFVGRGKQVAHLRRWHAQQKHVLILGPAGVGKSALVHHMASQLPLLVCPQSVRLADICGALENQLGLDAADQRLVQRKNRLLGALAERRQTVVFDGVGWTTPKISSLLRCVVERGPVWICTRSEYHWNLGHFWEVLCNFVRIELQPFRLVETRDLVMATARAGRIPEAALDAVDRLQHLSGGNPRVLCALLDGLATGQYDPHKLFDLKLLDLDRRIHELALMATFDKANLRIIKNGPSSP